MIVLLLGVCFLLRFPSLYTPLVDLDESVFAVCGEVVRQGGRLYVDCVDHQPPLIYWSFAALFRLFGSNNMIALHGATLLIVFLTALTLQKIAAELFGKSAGFWAALAYLLFSTTHIPKYISTNIETAANLPLVLAFLLWMRKERGEILRGFVGGVLGGVALLLKYQIAPLLFLWGLVLQKRPQVLLAALLGGISFLGLVLAKLAADGNLSPFFQETLARGWEYAQLGSTTIPFWKTLANRLGTTLLFSFPLWFFFAKTVTLSFRKGVKETLTQTHDGMLLLWFLGSFIAAMMGKRFYPHYFILLLPPLCLLAAPSFANFWTKISFSKRLVWSFFLACWTLFFLVPRINLQKTYHWFYQNYGWLDAGVEPMLHEKTYRAVGDYLRDHSEKGDRLVVWGFATPIYFFSGLLPGTSTIWSDDLTGRVTGSPATWAPHFDTSSFVRPGAWDRFIEEMARNKPTWFVDTSPANLTYYGKYPPSRYPLLSALLDNDYERVATLEKVDLYKKRVFTEEKEE